MNSTLAATLLVAIVSVIVSATLTPLVRRVAPMLGAVDHPGGRRVHVAATPRMGGAAVLLAYLSALGVAMATGLFPWTQRPGQGHATVGALMVGGALIAIVGAVDDIRDIGAKRKLLAQVLVASIAWWGGARIETITFPAFGQVFFGPVVSYFLSLAWILAFINAINLIDGLDGLAGGVVFFAALTNTAVAFISGNTLAAVLNAALGGAVLGFLFYNFNPATIFLGDTGSMFLGYALAVSALMSRRQKESTLVSLLIPLIALGIPITDTLFTMVRRFLANRPIFSADRGHIHHRLLDLGLTHRRAVLFLYGGSVVLCGAALAAAFGRSWQIGAALVGAVFTIVGIGRFAGYFEIAMVRRQQRAHLLSGPTDAVRKALPALVLDLAGATNRAGVWAGLERLLEAGPFAFAHFQPPGEDAPAWKWEPTQTSSRREGKLVECEFPLRIFPGSDAGVLRFGLLSDEPDLSPLVEVLLQVAADATEAALLRVHVAKPSATLRAVATSESA